MKCWQNIIRENNNHDELAKSPQTVENGITMKRFISIFILATLLVAVCGVQAYVPDPADSYAFQSSHDFSKELVPPSLSGRIICHNDPINMFDPDGELEHYYLTLNSQQYTQLNNYQSEGQYMFINSSTKAFSGNGKDRNNPNSTNVPKKGPLPKGTWYIVDRPKSDNVLKNAYNSIVRGKDNWFALYRKDGNVDDSTVENGAERTSIRLHPGDYSEGCLTIFDEEEFENIVDELMNTEMEVIPNTDIITYGTIEIQ